MQFLFNTYYRYLLCHFIVYLLLVSGLDSRISVKEPLTFLSFRNHQISKNVYMENKEDEYMNKDPYSNVSNKHNYDFTDDAFFYSDDDGKLILTGIEVHTQLASPYKVFCSCRSTASPLTNLNLSKHPDVYKKDPANNRKKVYEGFKRVLNDIASNHEPTTTLSRTHFEFKKPLNLEDYIKSYYDSGVCKDYGDVSEEELNSLISEENKHTCPVCRGEMGSTPYLSPMSLAYAIGICKVLNCKISNKVSFDRKCYEYFDLPKGFQITQTVNPLGKDGYLKLSTGKVVKIKQVQLEEDTARRIEIEGKEKKLDFNRSGIGLAEIVTAPCELTRSEILETCRKIYQRIVFNGLSNGNRFRGNFRFDINLSKPDGTNRIEVKNLNSFVVINKSVKNYDPEKDYTFKQKKNEDTTVLNQLMIEEMEKGDNKIKESILEKIKKLFLSIFEDVSNKEKYTPLGTTVKWNKEKGLEPMREKLPSEHYGNYFEINIPVIFQSDELIQKFTECLPNKVETMESFFEKYPQVKKELLKEIYKHHSWREYYENLCRRLNPQAAASHFVNLLLPHFKNTDKPLMPHERFSNLLEMVVNHRVNLSEVEKCLPNLIDYKGSLEEYFRSKNLLLYDLNKTNDVIKNYLNEHPLDISKSKDSDYVTKFTANLVHSADCKISYHYVREYIISQLNK